MLNHIRFVKLLLFVVLFSHTKLAFSLRHNNISGVHSFLSSTIRPLCNSNEGVVLVDSVVKYLYVCMSTDL